MSQRTIEQPPVAPSAPEREQALRRVPLEHRGPLGLDRRSFPYGLFVIAVFLVSTVVLPRLDDALAWDDPVRAGEQLGLGEDLAITPPAGWNVEEGLRLGEDNFGPPVGVTVVGHGVTVDVVVGTFDGTPVELLEQVEKVESATVDATFQFAHDPVTVTTESGEVGVVQTYSSLHGDGLVAALVVDGTGVEVTATGRPSHMSAAAEELDAMITSIRSLEEDGS